MEEQCPGADPGGIQDALEDLLRLLEVDLRQKQQICEGS